MKEKKKGKNKVGWKRKKKWKKNEKKKNQAHLLVQVLAQPEPCCLKQGTGVLQKDLQQRNFLCCYCFCCCIELKDFVLLFVVCLLLLFLFVFVFLKGANLEQEEVRRWHQHCQFPAAAPWPVFCLRAENVASRKKTNKMRIGNGRQKIFLKEVCTSRTKLEKSWI
jgi:hypothetical protein